MLRKSRTFVVLLVIVIPFTLSAFSAVQHVPEGGQAGFGAPAAEVFMNSLPQLTAAEVPAQSAVSRPLAGFTDAQRQQHKLQLIKITTGRSNGNAAPISPTVPPP